ncbi:hypothetical protein SESBI_40910 [Sesbania bispinosa]|nr:hypothetical protein SESBI_40910 [Sesbania bispinosa]
MLDVKLLKSFLLVDCNVLIEKEGGAGALQPYIVEMSNKNEAFVPQMNAKAMKAFSRANKRKQGTQASEPVIVTDIENEVSSSTISDKLISKKACLNKDPASPSAQPSASTEHPQATSANHGSYLQYTSCFYGTRSGDRNWVVGKRTKGKKIHKLKDQEEEITRAREITAELESLRVKFQDIHWKRRNYVQGDLTESKLEKYLKFGACLGLSIP